MTSANRYQRLRQATGLAAFVFLSTVLLAVTAHFATIQRSTGDEIAKSKSARDKLQAIADRLKTEANQADADKRVLTNFLRHCRTAEDIPDLGGNRIVARRNRLENFILNVPKGSHSLEISCAWNPEPPSDPPAENHGIGEAPAGEKSWNVPLHPACGYYLALSSDRNGGPIKWKLTSNHPEFTPRTETVPLDGFSHRGSSWSGSSVVQFPNQIERVSSRKLPALVKELPGVELMKTTLHGPRHDRQYEVKFNVRLLSDAPACVSASDAQRLIILGRADLLMPYEGGGKYDIRGSDSTEAPPK